MIRACEAGFFTSNRMDPVRHRLVRKARGHRKLVRMERGHHKLVRMEQEHHKLAHIHKTTCDR